MGGPMGSKRYGPPLGQRPEHRTHSLGLTCGILDTKHRHVFGGNTLVFGWAVRRDLDGDGRVLRGEWIAMERIAGESGASLNQVRHALNVLERERFLEVERQRGLGVKLSIVKPRKRTLTTRDPGKPTERSGDPGNGTEVTDSEYTYENQNPPPESRDNGDLGGDFREKPPDNVKSHVEVGNFPEVAGNFTHPSLLENERTRGEGEPPPPEHTNRIRKRKGDPAELGQKIGRLRQYAEAEGIDVAVEAWLTAGDGWMSYHRATFRPTLRKATDANMRAFCKRAAARMAELDADGKTYLAKWALQDFVQAVTLDKRPVRERREPEQTAARLDTPADIRRALQELEAERALYEPAFYQARHAELQNRLEGMR